MALLVLLAACGGSPRVREARCLADVGCPALAAIPPCTEPGPAMTVEELAASAGLGGERDDEPGEPRPTLAPGEHTAEGHAHATVTTCTELACTDGTCCNACGGSAVLTSSPTFDPPSDAAAASLVIGSCEGDDSRVCCPVPTDGSRLRVTFRHDGRILQPVRSCRPAAPGP